MTKECIAAGNTLLRSSRVGCRIEQQAAKMLEPLAEVFRFLFSGKKGSRCAGAKARIENKRSVRRSFGAASG